MRVSKIITNKQIYAQKTKIFFSFEKWSYLPQRGNWGLSKRVRVSKMCYNFIKRFTYTLKTIKIKNTNTARLVLITLLYNKYTFKLLCDTWATLGTGLSNLVPRAYEVGD